MKGGSCRSVASRGGVAQPLLPQLLEPPPPSPPTPGTPPPPPPPPAAPIFNINPMQREPEQTYLRLPEHAGGSTTPPGEAKTKKDLGTFGGVVMPCVLSLFGAILFLRLTWAVGKVGLAGVLCVFALATLTVVLTTLSLAAISTNGKIGGGGAYFMISRTLGPEFGGSTGVVFYFAQTFGIAFYLIAFSSNFSTSVLKSTDASDDYGVNSLVASATLAVLTGISMVGGNFFQRFSTLVFVALLASIVFGASSFLVPHEATFMVPSPNNSMVQIPTTAMVEWSWSTMAGNWMGKQAWGWTEFFDVFIVIFPAVTGVMAGANYSGDLADPGKSIGPGTLVAIAFSVAVYLLLAILAAGTVDNDILRNDLNVMEHACLVPVGLTVEMEDVDMLTGELACTRYAGGLHAVHGLQLMSAVFPLPPRQWSSSVSLRRRSRQPLATSWAVDVSCKPWPGTSSFRRSASLPMVPRSETSLAWPFSSPGSSHSRQS